MQLSAIFGCIFELLIFLFINGLSKHTNLKSTATMYNLEYICELFNFFVHKWPYKMYISFRFHYSKCLFSKLKGKLHISGSYMPNWSTMQKILLGIIWQYFALPKLHEVHMRAEVEKLGKQLHAYATSGLVSEDTACRLIKFHNYVVDFWKAKQGSSTISVVR